MEGALLRGRAKKGLEKGKEAYGAKHGWQTLHSPAGCFLSEEEELSQAWRWCMIVTYELEIAATLDKGQEHIHLYQTALLKI